MKNQAQEQQLIPSFQILLNGAKVATAFTPQGAHSKFEALIDNISEPATVKLMTKDGELLKMAYCNESAEL